MRSLIFLLAFLPSTLLATNDGARPRNLAYEDSFVWYLSGRLAHQLTEKHVRTSDIKLTNGEVAQLRDDYVILYRRYLVECRGPLPKIAENLRFFDMSVVDRSTETLSYVGVMESEIWPIITQWNSEVVLDLMDTFRQGKYEFLPTCIVAGFKAQNKI